MTPNEAIFLANRLMLTKANLSDLSNWRVDTVAAKQRVDYALCYESIQNALFTHKYNLLHVSLLASVIFFCWEHDATLIWHALS